MENEGLGIKGEVIVEELEPGTENVRSREVCNNIICAGGAIALAQCLVIGGALTPTPFNWMILSTSATAVSRTSTAIPATRFSCAGAITPTRVGSVVTWVNTFTAQVGASPIWKFGMENSTAGSGYLLNETLFSASKDNVNNDVRVTYNLSIAP
jgi:hypothetical protein